MNKLTKSYFCSRILLSSFLKTKLGGNQNVTNRHFRTSPPNLIIPPAIIITLSKVSKIGSAIVGRCFRWWWLRLPAEKKNEYFQRAKKKRKYFFGALGGISLLGLGYYQTHIEEAPITKRKRFVAFNDEQFNEIAIQIHASILVENESAIISPLSGHPTYKWVVSVAERLLNANKDIEGIERKFWRITVIDNDNEINAFVLACGGIVVYTGVLKLCSNDDQLAIILGHELAHAILGHGKESCSFSHLLDLFVMIPFAMIWALIPSDITSAALHWVTEKLMEALIHLPYSRFQEAEADAVGLQLAAKACFDVRETPVVWLKMEGDREGEDESLLGLDEWMSTHPSYQSRRTELSRLLPDALKMREDSLCPRLPFKNPMDCPKSLARQPVQSKELNELQVELDIKFFNKPTSK